MRVCVFCGASDGGDPKYLDTARDLGRLLAENGITVVYGGASVGLMGAVADAALTAGGAVIGVIPRTIVDRELAHKGLTEQHVVDSMHDRKAKMAELSDAFVALPGGIGTLEELFEVWTWAYLGIHTKPLGVINLDGFYQPLITMADHMVDEGFLKPATRALLRVAAKPADVLGAMALAND